MKKLGRTALIAAAILVVAFTANAQSQRLVMPDTHMSVSKIFHQIHRQTRLGGAYRTDQISPERMVTLPSRELSLGEIMELLTAGTGLKSVIDGDVIVFIRKDPAPGVPVPAASDGFVPTPLSQFKESLGLRPKSVVIEPDAEEPKAREMVVELEMPMKSYLHPAADYTVNQGRLPRFAIKTNLLYGLGTLTPNLSFEFGLKERTSLELGVSYNPWNLKGSLESNKKLVHMIVKPEFRYWLCERFEGYFFGLHALYARYNIGTHEVPMLFEKEYRYDGHALGVGITYGYNWAFAKRWSAEFAVGLGAMWLNYDRYDCAACNRAHEPVKETYFGPTNAAISLAYMIK